MSAEKRSAYTIINQINNDAPELKIELQDEQMAIFRLAKEVKRVKIKKRKVIFQHGDKFENILFLASGFLMMYRDFKGKRVFIRLYIPGDFVGLKELSELKELRYSIATLEDSIVYQIPMKNFKENIYNNPRLIKWLTDMLVESIYQSYKKYELVTCHNMEGRLAQSFLYFSKIVFHKDSFMLPLTKKQLGSYANVSPENVTRILKLMQSKKIINIKGKKYEILDKDALKDLCETC